MQEFLIKVRSLIVAEQLRENILDRNKTRSYMKWWALVGLAVAALATAHEVNVPDHTTSTTSEMETDGLSQTEMNSRKLDLGGSLTTQDDVTQEQDAVRRHARKRRSRRHARKSKGRGRSKHASHVAPPGKCVVDLTKDPKKLQLAGYTNLVSAAQGTKYETKVVLAGLQQETAALCGGIQGRFRYDHYHWNRPTAAISL